MTTREGDTCSDEEREAVRERVCPDCKFPLKEGPHGGHSVNWLCPNVRCGSKFNNMGPFGVQRISARSPRKRKASA